MRNSSVTRSKSSLVSTAAICAALYAIVNIATSFIQTPFGIGEFRPGVIIPAFFAITAGPIPAAIGAAVGSFIGDMISLVPTGKSTFIWAVGGGGIGNFFGFLALGWIYEKMKSWKGFVFGYYSGTVRRQSDSSDWCSAAGNFVFALVLAESFSRNGKHNSDGLDYWTSSFLVRDDVSFCHHFGSGDRETDAALCKQSVCRTTVSGTRRA